MKIEHQAEAQGLARLQIQMEAEVVQAPLLQGAPKPQAGAACFAIQPLVGEFQAIGHPPGR